MGEFCLASLKSCLLWKHDAFLLNVEDLWWFALSRERDVHGEEVGVVCQRGEVVNDALISSSPTKISYIS